MLQTDTGSAPWRLHFKIEKKIRGVVQLRADIRRRGRDELCARLEGSRECSESCSVSGQSAWVVRAVRRGFAMRPVRLFRKTGEQRFRSFGKCAICPPSSTRSLGEENRPRKRRGTRQGFPSLSPFTESLLAHGPKYAPAVTNTRVVLQLAAVYEIAVKISEDTRQDFVAAGSGAVCFHGGTKKTKTAATPAIKELQSAELKVLQAKKRAGLTDWDCCVKISSSVFAVEEVGVMTSPVASTTSLMSMRTSSGRNSNRDRDIEGNQHFYHGATMGIPVPSDYGPAAGASGEKNPERKLNKRHKIRRTREKSSASQKQAVQPEESSSDGHLHMTETNTERKAEDLGLVSQWNCRGDCRKRGALTQFLATRDCKPVAIAIQETGNVPSLSGYIAFCRETEDEDEEPRVATLVAKHVPVIEHKLAAAKPHFFLKLLAKDQGKCSLFLLNKEQPTHRGRPGRHGVLGYLRDTPKGRKLMVVIENLGLTLLYQTGAPTRMRNSVSRDTPKKTVLTTNQAPEIDPHLLHQWFACHSLTKMWKKQKHSRTPRKRIAELTKKAEQYAEDLTQANWHRMCDQLQGTLGAKKTWSIFCNLLDPTKAKTKTKKALAKLLITLSREERSRLWETLMERYIASRPRPNYHQCPESEDEKDEHPLDADTMEQEVRNALLHISHSTAPVNDTITYRILKNLDDDSISAFTEYFIRIWSTGEFPRACKRADIALIPKPGKPLSLQNLCPVSLTPCVGKLMEHIVLRRLEPHLESRSFFANSIFGFRPNFSAQDVLLQLKEDVLDHPSRAQTRAALAL
ncbi:hypothetical protein HPB47_005957 [Ixodes persulcatus]|uniref:Uncharacterized protein n=1 Tax=Ixodes persulcatus TaxID=34615 RepID=A0AC60PBK5_IXOPE|nr:hypothetical protein HPB47_005957 [Ixodes persulcatus]